MKGHFGNLQVLRFFLSHISYPLLVIYPRNSTNIPNSSFNKNLWRENTGVKETLLRSSLKRLEQQIPFSFIVCCHRSFIINLRKVNSITGNANGYRLLLQKHD
ncbi:LytTR family transcriptional regulator [candidate division KSB1 bacterium]|nr:LytTR family transcriptional regulator [candidate division KSB1 bacterium]